MTNWNVINNPKPHSCAICLHYPWNRHEPAPDNFAKCSDGKWCRWTKMAPFYTNECKNFEENDTRK